MSTITIRPLQNDDREGLLALCQKRTFPESVFLTSEERRRHVIASIERNFETLTTTPEVRCLVIEEEGEIVGSSLCMANTEEGTTGDRQTDLMDFHAPSPRHFEPLLEHILRQAKADGDAYVVSHIFDSQKREAMWLAKAGFRVESFRNAQEVAAGAVFPEHPNFRLRRARQSEVLYIMKLVITHSPLYAPAGRPVDSKAISARFLGVYSELDVKDKKKVSLIMAHRETDEPVGYMILQPKRVEIPQGKLTLYNYDIAVGEEAKGQGLGRYFNFGGMNLLAKMGGGVFFGDTPADNSIAQSASEALGFRPDSKRWGLSLEKPRSM